MSSWSWNISPRATTRAPPVSTRFDASSVPRPPQPNKPTRTAELAAVPRTRLGLINIAPAAPAVTAMNFRRVTSFDRAGFSGSTDMFPPKLSDQFLQIHFCGANVFELLRSGDLPLYGDRAAIIELLQPLDNTRKIHFAFANGNFFPKLLGVCGPHSVFGMNSLHVRTE